MSDKTIEVLKARVAELEREIEDLRFGSPTLFAGSITRGAAHKTNFTLAGIEEMILLVSPDGSMGYLNGPMARLLAIPERRAVLGEKLQNFDTIPGAEGILTSLLAMARQSEGSITVEPSILGLPDDRLPESGPKRPAGPVFLRFTAQHAGDNIQIAAQEITRLKWLEKTFSRYVPQQIIERLQFIADKDIMAPERRRATVLFADLRGFTALSERLDPQQVQQMLCGFLGRMVDAVNEMEGTVDKFAGDEIMAIFNAPQEQPDHALRALIAASRMLELHAQWQAEMREKGFPAPDVGIGLASGDVVVGNIGTETRSDYTAVGFPTNLAHRLCSNAPGGCIYTIYDTYEAAANAIKANINQLKVPHLSFERAGEMEFKNVSKPVKVIQVIPRLDSK